MQSDVLKEVIDDSVLLSQGYRFYAGYIFVAIREPANVFDAILIRNPSSAQNFIDAYPFSSHSVNDHINFINDHKIDKALIIADDISFISECPTLEHINIIPSVAAENNFDFSPLYDRGNLKSLQCSTKYGKFFQNSSSIDYSKISNLEFLYVCCDSDVNFEKISSLKTLSVQKYKGDSLNKLFLGKELDTLELTSCNIRTLDGMENIPKMQCLYLNHNRRLYDITALKNARKTIKALRICKCPKISDFSVLAQLENLEYLFLEGNNKIPNLDFLKSLPNLKTFIFDMEISDGNLLPCMRLSYAHCGKTHKHYNVSPKDLPKGIYYRGNDNIDWWRRIQ